jgi:hypothetical protein
MTTPHKPKPRPRLKPKPRQNEPNQAAAERAPKDRVQPVVAPDANDVRREASNLRARRAAQRIVEAELAAAAWAPPAPGEDYALLSDLTARPRTSPRYLVDGLQGWNHNASLAGQYKTGKTTLGLNYAKALVDGEDFLGSPTHLPEGSRLAWWNGEMDSEDFAEETRDLGVRHRSRIAVMNLRGRRLPIMDDVAARWTIEWLRDYEVGAWVIDSWRRLCTWSRLDENRNDDVERLTEQLDWIKAEAGVPALLVIAHTGRTEQPDGLEHARGATALDDWVDARWVLTRTRQTRFLAAEGRRVSKDSTALLYDSATHAVTLGSGGKREHRDAELLERLLVHIANRPGLSTSALADAVGHSSKHTGPLTHLLLNDTRVRCEDRQGGRGRYWYPAEVP